MEDVPAMFIDLLRKFTVEAILLTAATAIAIGSLVLYAKQAGMPVETAATLPVKINEKQTLMVDMTGAVANPGVYVLDNGARLKDAIARAGGLSETADSGFFGRNFNLARYLLDQEKIYVPNIDEVQNGTFNERRQTIEYLTPREAPLPDSNPNTGLINVNTAEKDELDSLPGIGEATAAKIIELRPFASIEDLLNKQAVKKNVFDQIKDLVSI